MRTTDKQRLVIGNSGARAPAVEIARSLTTVQDVAALVTDTASHLTGTPIQLEAGRHVRV